MRYSSRVRRSTARSVWLVCCRSPISLWRSRFTSSNCCGALGDTLFQLGIQQVNLLFGLTAFGDFILEAGISRFDLRCAGSHTLFQFGIEPLRFGIQQGIVQRQCRAPRQFFGQRQIDRGVVPPRFRRHERDRAQRPIARQPAGRSSPTAAGAAAQSPAVLDR